MGHAAGVDMEFAAMAFGVGAVQLDAFEIREAKGVFDGSSGGKLIDPARRSSRAEFVDDFLIKLFCRQLEVNFWGDKVAKSSAKPGISAASLS